MMNTAIEPALEGHPVAWCAPTYKMLSENWRALSGLLYPVTAGVDKQEHQIRLITGGKLDMWSLDAPDGPRGRKYKRIVVNEAAMIAQLEYAWNQVLRPTLADMRGDAYFGSTPKGLNYFFTLYQQDDPDWAHFKYSTYDNPYIPRDEIDAMRHALPERTFLQEIMAEFISDGSYFQNIDKAATIEKPDQPEQHAGHYLVMGTDWALSEDYTVLTVGCRDCHKVVDWERFNRIDFTYQRERLYAMADRWHIHGVLPERNSIGEPNIEIIRERVRVLRGPDGGMGFNTTATSKPALIQGLATALEHDGFIVPKDYADELRSYEVDTIGGHPKFSAPAGQHDDRVVSLALCWQAMTSVAWSFVTGDEQ